MSNPSSSQFRLGCRRKQGAKRSFILPDSGPSHFATTLTGFWCFWISPTPSTVFLEELCSPPCAGTFRGWLLGQILVNATTPIFWLAAPASAVVEESNRATLSGPLSSPSLSTLASLKQFGFRRLSIPGTWTAKISFWMTGRSPVRHQQSNCSLIPLSASSSSRSGLKSLATRPW